MVKDHRAYFKCDGSIQSVAHKELSYAGTKVSHRKQNRFQQLLDAVISSAGRTPIRAVVKHGNCGGMASILAKNNFQIVPDAGAFDNEETYFLNLPRSA